MSTFVTNCSFNAGGALKEENSYIKLKIGRGITEADALRQLVNAGTGEDSSKKEFAAFYRTTKLDFTVEKLYEFAANVDGDDNFVYSNNPDIITEGKIVNGQKWFTADLAKMKKGDDNEFIQKDEWMATVTGINQMLENVSANAALEFAFRSSGNFTGLSLRDENPNSQSEYWASEGKWPESVSRIFENFSYTMSADIDSKLVSELVGVFNALGMEDFFPPGFCGMFEKLDGLEMSFNVGNIKEYVISSKSSGDRLWTELGDAMIWFANAESREGNCPPAAFEDMRVIYFWGKDTYADLSICFPGYGQWLESAQQQK